VGDGGRNVIQTRNWYSQDSRCSPFGGLPLLIHSGRFVCCSTYFINLCSSIRRRNSLATGDGNFEMGLCDRVKREKIPNLEEAHTLITCADRSIRHTTEANWKLTTLTRFRGAGTAFQRSAGSLFIRNANCFYEI
jgi:hypothetical protein